MKCKKCGALLVPDALFCDKCGAKQEEEKKCKCGFILKKEFKFCPDCGKSLQEGKGAFNLQEKELKSKLESARQKGMIDVIKYFCKCGIYLDDDEAFNDEPILIQAASEGNCEFVNVLLSAGASVNVSDDDDTTPLHKAAENGHKDVVEILLAHNADVNAEDDYEDTPLSLAINNGHRAVASILKQHGGIVYDDD